MQRKEEERRGVAGSEEERRARDAEGRGEEKRAAVTNRCSAPGRGIFPPRRVLFGIKPRRVVHHDVGLRRRT